MCHGSVGTTVTKFSRRCLTLTLRSHTKQTTAKRRRGDANSDARPGKKEGGVGRRLAEPRSRATMVALSCRVLAVRVSLLSASFLRLFGGSWKGDPPFSVPATPFPLFFQDLVSRISQDHSLEPMSVLKTTEPVGNRTNKDASLVQRTDRLIEGLLKSTCRGPQSFCLPLQTAHMAFSDPPPLPAFAVLACFLGFCCVGDGPLWTT